MPQTRRPGEKVWPTQPFPTVAPPFARQNMTMDDMYTGFMTPEEKTWRKERLSKAKHGLYNRLRRNRKLLKCRTLPAARHSSAVERMRQRHRVYGVAEGAVDS